MSVASEPLIFELFTPRARRARAVAAGACGGGRAPCRRSCGARRAPLLPEVSELDAVRHYTRLSQLNFSIDTHFYPLGSCTMKYNPRACNAAAMLPEFLARHPLAPAEHGQGFLACLYELQEMLQGRHRHARRGAQPAGRAHGEFAGVAMIRAYHRARGDLAAQRDHRAAGGARHQSGDRDHVRLRRARGARSGPTAMSIWRRCAPLWARTRRASC